MAWHGGMHVNGSSIAKEVASTWNPLSSGRLLLYASLACFIALAIGIAGGWWNGSRLASGKAAKTEASELRAGFKEANQLIVRQQHVMADSSRQLEQWQESFAKISKETADARQQNRIEMAAIRGELEAALAARPDLAGVHVGSSVLDAWNAANRGRATRSAGAPPAAAGIRPKPAAAGTRKSAGRKKR